LDEISLVPILSMALGGISLLSEKIDKSQTYFDHRDLRFVSFRLDRSTPCGGAGFKSLTHEEEPLWNIIDLVVLRMGSEADKYFFLLFSALGQERLPRLLIEVVTSCFSKKLHAKKKPRQLVGGAHWSDCQAVTGVGQQLMISSLVKVKEEHDQAIIGR